MIWYILILQSSTINSRTGRNWIYVLLEESK